MAQTAAPPPPAASAVVPPGPTNKAKAKAPGEGHPPAWGVPRGLAKGAMLRVKLKSGASLMGSLVTETGMGLLVSTGAETRMLPLADIVTVETLAPAHSQ